MNISDKGSKQKQIVVIKLSGSIFNIDTGSKSLKEYAQLLLEIQSKIQPVVVAGGGMIARHYVNLARSLVLMKVVLM
jgi:uridylate kinase